MKKIYVDPETIEDLEPPKKEPTVSLTVRLQLSLWETLDKKAREKGLDKQYVIRKALEVFLRKKN